ncbi:hypothetical protein PAE9249_03888 [Paenibacillus sp. CECT 9249]|uniref:helix-turn-helix domain-containing protein n=1 Tax=Paenibacillus sp. CECT 9249 TaxID=2845385 RepID=UPI001E4A3FAD|nr:helix-turn-helix transcriptional regulator [Paenibacillus sp. CECT 9249]CAH0121361.1 hypothetical protein PAE9249_03888 [Paenibacillus sp. CECT 9249]
MSDFKRLVGEQIRHIRKQKEMTQEALANACGLQYSYISDVERGERNISIETLEKIVEALGVVPAEVFRFTHATMENDVLEKQVLIESLRALLSERELQEVKFVHRLASDFINIVEAKKKN